MNNIESKARPYSDYNTCLNFDSNTNNLIISDGYTYRVKLFQVAMVYAYKKLGMEPLIKQINLLTIDENNIEDSVYEHMDDLSTNGLCVQEVIDEYGWIFNSMYLDSCDFINMSNKEKQDYIDDLFDKDEQELVSGLLEDFYDEDIEDSGFGLSYITSTKVGRYLYYINNHSNIDYYAEDDILKLIGYMKFPFVSYGYCTAGLIGDTYYIGFLEGYKSDCYDFGPESIDMYYPLYAYYLDEYMTKAYKDLPIEEYYLSHPTGGNK